MEKTEMVKGSLRRLGYEPEIDEDGDVIFMCQMKQFYVGIGSLEDQFLSVVHPVVNVLGEDDPPSLAMAVCNRMNRRLKLMKAYVEPKMERVEASVDFYYFDEDSLDTNMQCALELLGCARRIYNNTKLDLTKSLSD